MSEEQGGAGAEVTKKGTKRGEEHKEDAEPQVTITGYQPGLCISLSIEELCSTFSEVFFFL